MPAQANNIIFINHPYTLDKYNTRYTLVELLMQRDPDGCRHFVKIIRLCFTGKLLVLLAMPGWQNICLKKPSKR
jgi:hypothetical protein